MMGANTLVHYGSFFSRLHYWRSMQGNVYRAKGDPFFLCWWTFIVRQADSGKLGSSEGSSLCRSTDDDMDANECLGQVPEFPWRVPEIPSPPTASGLSWQKDGRYSASDNTAFVPEMCSSIPHGLNYVKASFSSKRRYRQWWESWRWWLWLEASLMMWGILSKM